MQICCDFLGGFEEKVYFCGRLQSKNFKKELLWIHWIKNFGKNVKQLRKDLWQLKNVKINASAPYEVYWYEKSRTYRFKSDFGVVLAIGFDDDDIIENAESYVFSIINVNKIPSSRDLKMRDTVMLIIENFFNINEAALLYICESGDGKQLMRSRLFEYWFSSYQMKDKFILMPVSIEDMDGVENFAALIIRKDNPNILDIVAEFSNTVAMFRVKPDSQD